MKNGIKGEWKLTDEGWTRTGVDGSEGFNGQGLATARMMKAVRNHRVFGMCMGDVVRYW